MTLEELIEEGNNFSITQAGFQNSYKNGLLSRKRTESHIENEDKYYYWIEICKRFLITNYKSDFACEHFEEATKEAPKSNADIKKLVAILKSLIGMPTICETKKDMSTNVQNINVSQSQNQSQNINIDIVLQAIKDELGPNGIEDLKDIKGDTEEAKKKNLLSKLKGFGEATLSNILANIITNPTIWEQLFK